jgi:D-alanine-D-alanine ligase
MKAVILYDKIVEEGGSPDQRDVLEQAKAVRDALTNLGFESATLPFSFDLKSFMESIRNLRPNLVFNLVESVEGHGRLLYLPSAILDSIGIPYTGSPTDALYLTTNKLLTKKILTSSGIKTPRSLSEDDLRKGVSPARGHYIIKSVWEHASVGLDEESVISVTDPAQLLYELKLRKDKMGGECFAEEYIEGREFNLSVLASQRGPEALPPAEMRFEGYPPGKWKVVGYRAKWDDASFESLHTRRSFDFDRSDEALLHQLKEISTRCWLLFALRGYARVDFRVDEENQPWVLEINANPCLSPDAGFMAAAAQAGLNYKQVVQRIIEDSGVPVQR